MLKGKWTPIVWSGIHLLMLLFLIVPPISLLAISFMMIPTVILYVKVGKRAHFVLWYAATIAIVYLLTGLELGSILLVVALFFLAPSVVMGEMYRRRSSARAVLTAGIVAIMAVLLAVFIIGALNGFDIKKSVEKLINNSLTTVPDVWKNQLTPEVIDRTVSVMVQMIPLCMIYVAFYYTVITHWISRRLLNKLGENVPKLKPVREWMLPKSLVWYYLLALILEMFIRTDNNGMLAMILVNLLPLLLLVFSIQAIAFLFYVAHEKRWSKLLPIVGIVLLVLFPPSQYILSLLGVMDVAFPIRDRLFKQ